MQILRAPTTLLLLLALLLTSLVACSDDDDDGGGSGNTATATTEAQDDGNSDAEMSDDDDDDGTSNLPDFGDGLVVVTIGDDRYEFDLNEGFNVCRDVFGGLQFSGAGPDDTTSVSGWIPPADWESYDDDRYDPPGIEVDVDATNSQWIADAGDAEFRGIAAGLSQVDSFEIDGLRASGTATFYDTFALEETEPVQGTFEISCTE